MQTKSFFVFIILMAFSLATFAQDRIYRKNGKIEEVKILEVGPKFIKYKKWDNQEGPDFVLAKSEIKKIKYQNQEEETFSGGAGRNNERSSKSNNEEYGKNILSLAPVQFTNTSVKGFGISYERILGEKGIVSFYLPVAFSFNDNGYYDAITQATTDESSHFFWFYPGAKFYPAGSMNRFSYAVGASIAIGAGNEYISKPVYDPVSGITMNQRVKENVYVMGVMINNSVNFQPTPRVYVGIEFGFGIPYTSNQTNDVNNYNDLEDSPLVQLQFKLGYRFK